MKKKTNLQTGPEGAVEPRRARKKAAAKEARQHGPLKEKTQITIRLDAQLADRVYSAIQADNTRITDMIEHGLNLALAERQYALPAYTKQIRFVLANATKDQQKLLRGLAIAMVEPEVGADIRATVPGEGKVLTAQVKGPSRRVFLSYSRTPEAEKLWELVEWFLQGRNEVAHAEACLEYYSRYGKTAEEIAELGRL